MAQPSQNWLIDPVIPAPPAMPRLDRETAPTKEAPTPTSAHPSGTWLVGAHPYLEADASDDRFATSDAEAPTVRPGALRALMRR